MEAVTQDKAELALEAPLFWVPVVLKGLPTDELTSRAPSQDRNIFTSCLPRPLA